MFAAPKKKFAPEKRLPKYQNIPLVNASLTSSHITPKSIQACSFLKNSNFHQNFKNHITANFMYPKTKPIIKNQFSNTHKQLQDENQDPNISDTSFINNDFIDLSKSKRIINNYSDDFFQEESQRPIFKNLKAQKPQKKAKPPTLVLEHVHSEILDQNNEGTNGSYNKLLTIPSFVITPKSQDVKDKIPNSTNKLFKI